MHHPDSDEGMGATGDATAADAGSSLRKVLRYAEGATEALRDAIATEVPVALAFNGAPFAVMMATPADLEDFALGFSLSEGIVADAGDLVVESIEHALEGVAIRLRIPAHAADAVAGRTRGIEGRSGCGICGSSAIEDVLRPPPPVPAGKPVAHGALERALSALAAAQPLNARTGATHAAAWVAPDGTLRLVREDVGRHNALDKLVGAMVRQGLPSVDGFALVTSRASYEMALKAARAGFPLLAAISAPTALAVTLADAAGMTLVGFARPGGHVVYCHPGRMAGAADGAVSSPDAA